MHERPVLAIEHPIEHFAPAGDRTDRHEAARERLGQQHEVRLDPPVLRRQKATGAPHAGLDLVGDEQRAVGPAQAGRFGQIVVAREIDPLPLNRLDHERRDVTPGERPLERGEVVEGHRGAGADERPEPLAKRSVAAQRQRAIGQTWKA